MVRRYRSPNNAAASQAHIDLSALPNDDSLTPATHERHNEGDQELIHAAQRVAKDAANLARERRTETGFDDNLLTLKFAGTWTLTPNSDGFLVDTGSLGQFTAPTMEPILQSAMRMTLSRLNGDWEYISVQGIRPKLDSTYELTRDGGGRIIMEVDNDVHIHPAPMTSYPQSLWLYNKGEGGPISEHTIHDLSEIQGHLYYSFDEIPKEYKVVEAVLTSSSGQPYQSISIPFGGKWNVFSKRGELICTIENREGYLHLTNKVWDDSDDNNEPLPGPIIQIPDVWVAEIQAGDK